MDELRKRLRKQRLKFHRFFLGAIAPLWMQLEGFSNRSLPAFPTGKPVQFQLQVAAQLAMIRFFLPLSVAGLAVAYYFSAHGRQIMSSSLTQQLFLPNGHPQPHRVIGTD